ncbi:O-antigen polymerase [Thermobaculum terrenum ATCC BAA-798]|uniref:O-antigen polymerase n=1 Tax=Thermobaculum terrenum (strain ATCC BAA-798 / CCMEE 7001 / YNP1) TaxID=525904 RepID=D1CIX2_THET1|nr:O-antigen ligase family protein [Thermobaculum terrenum]ACZ43692.1 O-antigen polymerase [Thermobaculum terrenum ATCC BAA-798]
MTLATEALRGRRASGMNLRLILLMVVLAAMAISLVLPIPGKQQGSLVLGLCLASILLVLNSPAWAAMPVLLTEMTLSSYYVGDLGMSLRLLVVLLGFIVSLPMLRRVSLSDPLCRRVLLPALLLLVIATAVNALYSESDYVIKYARYQTTQLLAMVLIIAVVATVRDVKKLATALCLITVVVSIASILQHYAPSIAPYGLGDANTVRDWKGRSIGFSSSPVTLANQIAFVVMPLMGVFFSSAVGVGRRRILALFGILLLVGGLNFSYTRSAFFALAPATVALALCLKGRVRIALLAMVLLAVVAFQLLRGTGLIGSRYYKTAEDDRSAASHQALWDVGFAIAMDHPILGIGHEHFEEVSAQYVDELNTSADAAGGTSAVGKERPHNDFLSVWTSWGIFALLAYLALFWGMIRNYMSALGHSDRLISGLAAGCVGGVVLYAVNSAYHNYMDSSSVLWIYAGFSVVLARLARLDSLSRLYAAYLARQRSQQEPLGR